MKVKLLKKVRKRFTITHHPKGIVRFGKIYNYNLFILTDIEHPYYEEFAQCGGELFPTAKSDNFVDPDQLFTTEIGCINYLKDDIIRILKVELFSNNKMRLVKRSSKVVWYVK